MEDLDPDEARAIADPALKPMIDAVHRYLHRAVHRRRYLRAVRTYEDHSQCGLYAALRMQQELGEYGHRRAAIGGHLLEARIGINTGDLVVRSVETGGKLEYTQIAHTANLASRQQTVAPASSIAASE